MSRWLAAILAAVVGLWGPAGCKDHDRESGGAGSALDSPSAPETSTDTQAPVPEKSPGAKQGPPFLFEVSRDNKTSYLFGTMHVGVDATTQVHPGVWKLLAKSDRVVLEIVSSDLSMEQSRQLLFLPDGKSLRGGLEPKQWDTLRENVTGMEDAQLARVSPLMASVLLASQWLPETTPLDQEIESRARAAGKDVRGLESFAETRKFTQNLAHTKYLAVMLDDLERAKRELRDMHGAYLAGDADKMVALVFSDENLTRFPELYEELFYKRNQSWIPKIVKHLEAGKAFIAVGAGHLLGERSVVGLLKGAGYRVERVVPPQ